MRDEEIALQDFDGWCAHAAIVNMLGLRGLPAPSQGKIDEMFQVLKQIPSDEGATQPTKVAQVLSACGLLCGLVVIPHPFWSEPQRLLKRFIDQGFQLLVFFNWKADDKVSNHVSIVEGYNEQGYACIDSDGLPSGSRIDLEPKYSEAEMAVLLEHLDKHPHGSRVLLPYYPVFVMPHSPLGLSPHVIVVWPEIVS